MATRHRHWVATLPIPHVLLALLVLVAGAAPGAAQVSFTEVAATALPGIATAPGQTFTPPAFTGGAAAGDCDGDGLPDLYFTGLSHDVLYRNRGDGTFEDVTVAANLGESLAKRGAAFGDLDNDGDLDLYVSSLGGPRHYLYVNDGTCRFSEEALARGAAFGSPSTGRSVSLGDYDRDGYLDVYVAEWQSEFFHPNAPGPISHLFRNRGASAPGFFTDVTASAGVVVDGLPGSLDGTFPLTGRFTDFDRDGWPDLALISDFGESRLFWNDGDGTFTDGTEAAGVGTDEHGMGAATGDLDGDGRFDLFVTSIYAAGFPAGTGNRLYRNLGNRTFADVTDAAGVREGYWGWGTEAFDYDNDGDLDLVMANGSANDEGIRILTELEFGPTFDVAQFADDPLRFWRNDGGGVFTEASLAVGLYESGVGHGVLPFDSDGDGDLDLLVTHEYSPPLLFRNDGGNAGHWLDVELEGREAHPNGIGAVLTLVPVGLGPAQVREVSASSTYVAQDGTARVHFGLGPGTPAVDSITIEWSSGTVQRVKEPAIDGVVRVTEDVPDPARAQADCVLALNKAGEKLGKVLGQRLQKCVKAATAGTLAPGDTASTCLAADPNGKSAARQAKTELVAANRCGLLPVFGAASAAEVNAAILALFRPQDFFGPDLDGALLDGDADPAGAACQIAVTKGIVKIAGAQVKAFNRCKKFGLKRGLIASRADLEACLAAAAGPDVAKIAASVARGAERTCAGIDLAAAFPGKCSGPETVAALFDCVRAQSYCGTCMALNGADRLDRSCHAFVEGVATVYCGDRPVTTQSIARQWDEALLAAIRLDTPRPTTHARNLWHLAGAMWDAWRAYGGGGSAWVTDESQPSADPARDREIAISFAAYRLLSARFLGSPNVNVTEAALRARMYALGFDVGFLSTEGDTPAAVGNRIGAATLAWGLGDGANEQGNYSDSTYVPANAPLIVKAPGATMVDPNRWQPLALDLIVTQNGIPLPDKVQTIIGAGWNGVAPFALVASDPNDVYIDPGPPPFLGVDDAGYKAGARRVIELSSQLDPGDGVLVDISPGALGNHPLGTNDGTGHPVNPATGQPYAPNVVPRGDFLRVLAEFWADGPQSETPPGHWNVLANEVSDTFAEYRIGGAGPSLDRLEWDVKLYLTLNGAVHDAAVVAWGLKRKYDSARPISMIRWLAGNGQSSDPNEPSYDPDGIVLEPGLIELITPATTAPGERHAALAGHEGEIAIYAYGGPPVDPTTGPVGATWIRGVEWVPYQKRTFVTPAFPGYTSGHSTFSRAAAEVMALFTGDPYFPGGLGEFAAPADAFLQFERGPSVDVVMQWGTYYDAADQAGLSRLPGGIHVPADDFNGRITGSQVGIQAFARAQQYFGTP